MADTSESRSDNSRDKRNRPDNRAAQRGGAGASGSGARGASRGGGQRSGTGRSRSSYDDRPGQNPRYRGQSSRDGEGSRRRDGSQSQRRGPDDRSGRPGNSGVMRGDNRSEGRSYDRDDRRGDDRRNDGRSYGGGQRRGEGRSSGREDRRDGGRSYGGDGGRRGTGRSYGDRDRRDGERRDGGRSYGRDGQRSGGSRYSEGSRGPSANRRDSVRRDDRRSERDDGSRRGDRTTARPVTDVPDIPEEISIGQLDRSVRARLRTLSKDNAEDVGRHLVMAGLLLDVNPELAYKHAQVAVSRAGRVDVVREAGAVAAYATGRYGEALRELRTVRRLNGSNEHLALMADCERGLGRPERALALAREAENAGLDARQRAEFDLVLAGARMDLGEVEAAYVALTRIDTPDSEVQARLDVAMVDVLRALGRTDEADKLEATLPPITPAEDPWADDVTLYDVQELPDPDSVDDGDEAANAVGETGPDNDTEK